MALYIKIRHLSLRGLPWRNIGYIYHRFSSNCFIVFAVLFLKLFVDINANHYFDVQPEDTTVLIGESFTLYCRVVNRTGVTYWERDNLTFAVPGDGQFPASDRWAVFGDIDSGEYNLQVLRAESEDQGIYQCKSTSSIPGDDEISSALAEVTAVDIPTGVDPICLTSKTGSLTAGDPVDFTCGFVSGNDSIASVTWVRSGPRISENQLPLSETIAHDGYIVRKMTVTITINDHLATYTCHGKVGTESQTVACSTGSLLVKHAPLVSLEPSSVTTDEGSSANFSCILDSAYPKEVIFEWYYMGRMVVPGGDKLTVGNLTNGESLSLINLSGYDDGTQISCVVRNSEGVGTANGIITLRERPFDLERDILIWLIPLGAIALVMILAILLAICVLDCRLLAACCDKRQDNVTGPKARTWSVANLAMTLRARSPVELDDEYFIARSIRSRDNTGIRPDKNTEDRKVPESEEQVNPNFILAEKAGSRNGTADREKQRKTRSKRDQMRRKSALDYADDDTLEIGNHGNNRSLSRIKKQESQNVDSGMESNGNYSPTLQRLQNNVREKKALYAEVERINLGL